MRVFALVCLAAWVASCRGSRPLPTDGGMNTRRDGAVETIVDAGRDHAAMSDAPVDRQPGGGGAGGAGGGAGTRGATSPDGSGDRPAGSGGSAGDAATPEGGRPPIGCGAAGLFDTATSALVNAFVTPDGIIVVRALDRFARARSVRQADGDDHCPHLDIQLRRSDARHRRHGQSERVHQRAGSAGNSSVADPCFDSFIAPGGVFVCESKASVAPAFTTFDVRGRRLLKDTGTNATAGSQVMELAPGTPYFGIQLQSSPSIFVLDAADPDGTVRQLGGVEAGDVLNKAFGFGGAPPSHLILPTGTLLRMLGPMCDGTASTAQSGCLQPDGTIGTLQTHDRFIALDSDGRGGLIGLVSHTGSSDVFDSAPCQAGCALQKIDFPSRTVTATKDHVLTIRTMLFLRDDPTCKMAVVGYQQPATSATVRHSRTASTFWTTDLEGLDIG